MFYKESVFNFENIITTKRTIKTKRFKKDRLHTLFNRI